VRLRRTPTLVSFLVGFWLVGHYSRAQSLVHIGLLPDSSFKITFPSTVYDITYEVHKAFLNELSTEY
jgi:hypothetical protein